jgi:hypothetical protein
MGRNQAAQSPGASSNTTSQHIYMRIFWVSDVLLPHSTTTNHHYYYYHGALYQQKNKWAEPVRYIAYPTTTDGCLIFWGHKDCVFFFLSKTRACVYGLRRRLFYHFPAFWFWATEATVNEYCPAAAVCLFLPIVPLGWAGRQALTFNIIRGVLVVAGIVSLQDIRSYPTSPSTSCIFSLSI